MDQYIEIAAILVDACPSAFTKTWIEAEVKDDWSKQRVWCESLAGKLQPDVPSVGTFKIGQKLQQIRAQMTVPGQQPWSRCTFTLFPDGKFKFDVEYDN